MREIAKSAGMSMGQMYHYISSKDDVLFLIIALFVFKYNKRVSDPFNPNNNDIALITFSLSFSQRT